MFVNEVRFLNGSLAREFIRFEHGLDWSAFSRLLEVTPAGNDGVFMLPWLEDEMTPPVWHRGIRRFGFGAGNPALDVRAVVEAQMMAMANHSAAVTGGPASRVVVTGDGAIDRPMLQLHWLEGGHAACLGAALRAYHADRMATDHPIAWPEVVRGFTDAEEGDRISPIPAHVPLYAELRKRYADAESLHKEREPIC
jgi:sugar (pentulose or hexulose) kinase